MKNKGKLQQVVFLPPPKIYMNEIKIFQYTNEQGEIIVINASFKSKIF